MSKPAITSACSRAGCGRTAFKRDGETVYVVERICDEFSRAPKRKAEEAAA
jgi:hypothetical protein